MTDPRVVIGRGREALRTLCLLAGIASAGGLALGCSSHTSPGSATGGTGGGSGAGGTGRGGGGGGLAADCGAATTTESPACGAALCGNGTRDSCQVPGNGFGGSGGHGGGSGGTSAAESCDGSDLSVFDCRSFSFASGTLRCTSSCTFDLSGCEECAAPTPSVSFCGPAAVGAINPSAIAVAATDAEIGLAWVGTDDAGVTGLHFTQLSPNLAALSFSRLDGNAGATAVAVAPLPSGWAVAAGGDTVTLHAIGADGLPVGMTTVAATRSLAKPVLAARPGTGPVIVWMPDANTLRAAFVAADGLSTAAPIDLPLDGAPSEYDVGAAFVGGAVHVVTVVDLMNVRIVRIQPDGSASLIRPSLSGLRATSASLVAGAAALEIVFYSEGRLLWGRLDAAGTPILPAVNLGNFNGYTHALAIASGADSMVLIPETDGQVLRLRRIVRGEYVKAEESTIANTRGTRPDSHASAQTSSFPGSGGAAAAPRPESGSRVRRAPPPSPEYLRD